jgi:ABC-type branched-subunit amino acid transport system ATPase component
MLRAGVAYVLQGNRVFTDLTMRENLEMDGFMLPTKRAVGEGMERVFALFPALRNRIRFRFSRDGSLAAALHNVLDIVPQPDHGPRQVVFVTQGAQAGCA